MGLFKPDTALTLSIVVNNLKTTGINYLNCTRMKDTLTALNQRHIVLNITLYMLIFNPGVPELFSVNKIQVREGLIIVCYRGNGFCRDRVASTKTALSPTKQSK